MKKSVCLLLSILLCVMLVACDESNNHVGEIEDRGDDIEYTSDKWTPSEPESVKTLEPTDEPTKNLATQPPVEEILTIENCPEFAAVMAVQYPDNPLIKEFADKYKGRIIAFDGNIDSMCKHEDDTKYDFVIYAGDYSNINITGPSFRVTDVTIDDLNLVGENIPDHIDSGLDIHIIAEIRTCEYHIELRPISIEVR